MFEKFKSVGWDAIIIFIIVILFITQDGWGLLNEKGEAPFRIEQQLYLPALFGALGGYSYILMQTMEKFAAVRYHEYAKLKFAFLGSISGVAAVNLLNPTGSVSQIIILSLIAGLSCVSYLKRNALVDTKYEDSTVENWAKEEKAFAYNTQKEVEKKLIEEHHSRNKKDIPKMLDTLDFNQEFKKLNDLLFITPSDIEDDTSEKNKEKGDDNK